MAAVIMNTVLQELIRDPEGQLGEPVKLVERSDLTNREKLVILESWQADLLELQKAAEENMASVNRDPGVTAARLAEVMAAIALLHEAGERSH
jgi:hypothetical protein